MRRRYRHAFYDGLGRLLQTRVPYQSGAPGTQAVIDVANKADYNVTVSAPYVIVRGLVLKGARIDSLRMLPGSSDVVIEDNDISDWGRPDNTGQASAWPVGLDLDAAIRADCGSTCRHCRNRRQNDTDRR